MSEAFSRSQTPPQGWIFYQPQTKWSAPTPIASTFDQTVILIIKHRLANPAVVVKNNLATDVVSVGNELEAFTRARLGIAPMSSPKMPAPPSQPQMSGAVSAVVANVKKLAAGAALLMEWDSSGLAPVAKDLAEKRAGICSDCPMNAKGKSLSDFFTVPMADMTRRRFERLEAMNLTTSFDEKLSTCQACLCPLRLKVWTPMELIAKRLKPEQRAELDPRCWILQSS
jgi:hypothetical protein